MHKEILPIAALGFLVSAAPLYADELAMPEGGSAPTAVSLPTKGMSMSKVEAAYGEPSSKRPPVGGESPVRPPITRWDYPGFSVFFEHDKVVDAVVPGAPPPIVNRQGLEPAEPSEAPPAMVESEDAMEAPAAEPVATEQTLPVAEDPGLVEDRERALREAAAREAAESEAAAPTEEGAEDEGESVEDAMPAEDADTEPMAGPEEAVEEEYSGEEEPAESEEPAEPDFSAEPQPLE